MADMQTIPGRIRKHVQTIVFWLLAVIDIDRRAHPFIAPFLFDFSVIKHGCHSLSPLVKRGCL